MSLVASENPESIVASGHGARPNEQLHVALDVRLPPGQWGGVQHVIQGLASGFATLSDAIDYVFVGYEDADSWLEPVPGGVSRRITVPRASGRTPARRVYDAIASKSDLGRRMLEAAAFPMRSNRIRMPTSDGTLERLGADVVHFVLPQAFLTAVPSLYQVHDLLHAAHPELFSAAHRRYREATYSTFARQARLVVTMTEWGRRQIVDLLGIPPPNVAVVPWAPVIGKVPSIRPDAVARIDDLPERYLLYPAQTWSHKNHLGLIEALAILKARGRTANVVLTGLETAAFARSRQRIQVLGLQQQVRVLGRVPDSTLVDLYRRARGLVFPSRYEGWGLPIVEAFAFGLPVAASNVTAIPEVAGGAALLFDPEDPVAIADAIERITDDDALRSELRARGLARVSTLTWTSSARHFRALYRLVGGKTLAKEDDELLEPPVLVH